MVSKSDVLRYLNRFRLERYRKLVIDALEPAVRLVVGRRTRRGLSVGHSKFGGEPDLHDRADWPMHPSGRPLHFLAQIRLSDLSSRGLLRRLLPRRGWLWFWQDQIGAWFVENTSIDNDWRTDWRTDYLVTFSPDERGVTRCEYPSFEEPDVPKRKRLWHYQPLSFNPGPEAAMRFDPVMSVHFEALGQLFNSVEVDDPHGGFERALEFYSAIHGDKCAPASHRLMGDFHEMMTGDLGSNMRVDCVNSYKARRARKGSTPKPPSRREVRQWRLLAKFDDDDRLGWCFGDVATLCFWIRDQDLAQQDFSEVQAHVDSA